MTCIVALTDGKTVWLGGDSAGVNEESMVVSVRADTKVSAHKDNGISWGFGFTTSYRMGQLIRYHLTLPPITKKDREDLFGYMVSKFIPELRDVLTKGGVSTTENGVETCGEFIVGLMGKIFTVEADFQVTIPIDHFCAVGSGAPFALGALKVLEKIREAGHIDPESQVREALAASEFYSAGVRQPFTIVSIPYTENVIVPKATKKKR